MGRRRRNRRRAESSTRRVPTNPLRDLYRDVQNRSTNRLRGSSRYSYSNSFSNGYRSITEASRPRGFSFSVGATHPTRPGPRGPAPDYFTSVRNYFRESPKAPKEHTVCSRRNERKRVIFATGQAGKGGQKAPVWTNESRIRCRRK